ncbi:MAG TPA: ABC transporter ATP-binding protein [Candidatus Sulfotelmatobacter sp.]|nr:ABC transporter ATP-binding protein [Candidatus Sulfotelmatobacter sp.]
MADTPAVSIEGLTKAFPTGAAIQDLSFTIQENEFVTLVGPSGCGKSTTLRMISGLMQPTRGSVRLRGQAVAGPIRDVGMVFQSPVLLPWRTTLSNVLFPADMRGIPARDCRPRALELIRLASLDGFEERYPHELSGGMQQRVAICRALLLGPSLLLMDEPFGALDIMTREKLGFELQKIWSASKTTVLFVTHSITEAVLLSDTIIVMTARPGKAKAVIPVDLPRPRDVKTLRDPKFVELSALVRDNIEAQWVE